MTPHPTVVSFVHGYRDLEAPVPEGDKPALWVVNGAEAVHAYPFPRNPGDFHAVGDLLAGEAPLAGAPRFRKLPRFGLTGLAQTRRHLWAGSWNGVYRIRKRDYALEAIVSHRLMSDLHGIWADEETLLTVLTSKDTVVTTDHDGRILDHFSVGRDLRVSRDRSLESVDWRFVSKQFRGSTGFWHFNYVQKIDGRIWLTSRNVNAFVVVDPACGRAEMRLMNLCTPALIHDGVRKADNRHYLTSIDGKILIAADHRHTDHRERERADRMELYNRDLVTVLIRLEETGLNREPNWCRGIDAQDGVIYVTIDGRYDTDLSFGLLALREADRQVLTNRRLRWEAIGPEAELRFVTGFDVVIPN